MVPRVDLPSYPSQDFCCLFASCVFITKYSRRTFEKKENLRFVIIFCFAVRSGLFFTIAFSATKLIMDLDELQRGHLFIKCHAMDNWIDEDTLENASSSAHSPKTDVIARPVW